MKVLSMRVLGTGIVAFISWKAADVFFYMFDLLHRNPIGTGCMPIYHVHRSSVYHSQTPFQPVHGLISPL